MIIFLIALAFISSFLYWDGGEQGQQKLYRQLGVSLLIVIGLAIALGWHWTLLIVLMVSWAGLSLGDYSNWHWSVHAFVVAMATFPYAWVKGLWLPFGICMIAFPAITMLWSKYIKFFDIFQRGFLFGATPLIFYVLRHH